MIGKAALACLKGDTACGAGMNQVAKEHTLCEERVNLAGLGCSDFQKGPGRWALSPGSSLPSIFVCMRVEVTGTSLITVYANCGCGECWFCSGDWSLISWGHLSRCCLPPDWPLITIWTLTIEPTFLIKTTLHMLSWVTVETIKHTLASPLGEDSGNFYWFLCTLSHFSLLIPPVSDSVP